MIPESRFLNCEESKEVALCFEHIQIEWIPFIAESRPTLPVVDNLHRALQREVGDAEGVSDVNVV
jgi:hypothetical protein